MFSIVNLFIIISAIFFAIIFVGKSEDFPIKYFHSFIKRVLKFIFGEKISGVLDCSVCLSFWVVLIFELIFFFIYGTISVIFWPFSGFIAAGFIYVLFDIMDILEKNNG